MGTSVYFNNFQSSQEQILIENLIIESIRIYGHDVYYLPRTIKNKDEIYGTDTVSEYNNSYFLDFYIRSYDSYQGDGTFLSKFNLEIRDQITFTVAVRTFDDEVGMYESIERPREGDLIYSTMMKRLFVIKYVDFRPVFYQLGALQMYDIICEVFEYSSERFNTGIEEIDEIEQKFTTSMDYFGIKTQDGYYLSDQNGYDIIRGEYDLDTQSQDTFADNDEIETEADSIIDWSQKDPFSEGKV
jgi:hypothetical protein